MGRKRVIFFGSGDFPRKTFEHLISSMKYLDDCPYEIVGLVTSHDKCEDNGDKLAHIASESDILVAVCKDCNDEGLYDWCKDLNPDIFVVISFKKIPQKLLDLVNGNAFNVHASLLPLLRGANPIRWAIRYGMTETGLTAIELSNKIDCGNILQNAVIPIDKDDNYGSLKEKMADKCASFTDLVLRKYYVFDTPKPSIAQSDCGTRNQLFYAPKLNLEYFATNGYEDLGTILKSVAPYDGIRCRLTVYEKCPTTQMKIGFSWRFLTSTKCIIWKMHKAEQGEKMPIEMWSRGLVPYQSYIVDEIQIDGKKRMSFESFMNGYKYLKKVKGQENNRYKVSLDFY